MLPIHHIETHINCHVSIFILSFHTGNVSSSQIRSKRTTQVSRIARGCLVEGNSIGYQALSMEDCAMQRMVLSHPQRPIMYKIMYMCTEITPLDEYLVEESL